MTRAISRRRFVQGLAAAGAIGPTILSSLPKARAAANERLTLGMIGVGTMGRGHVGRFLGYGDVQIVAVADVVAERREHSKKRVEEHYAKQTGKESYRGCAAYNDFRELLALDGLDAVLIATPDHWHAIPAILAARAGKDIYCEKPLTLTIGEGRRLVDEVARSERRLSDRQPAADASSADSSALACELIRNGRIGKIKTIRVGVGDPPVPAICPSSRCPQGPIGISGSGRLRGAATTRCSAPRGCTSISRPSATTASTPAAGWPTWGPITSTSPSGPWTWTAAAR